MSAYMYILIQGTFQIKKENYGLEILRAWEMDFILRVPVFTHFYRVFQCCNSSYEGHFAMYSLYALLFMMYFLGLKL
jgi:hypothetical protein